MSARTELAVYETFEEIFKRKSLLDELIADIRRFDQTSLIWVCAEIISAIQVWDKPDLQHQGNYLGYLQELFDASTRNRLIAGYRSQFPRRLLFHRRQILLIVKLAILHCSTGLDARSNRQQLGLLFLKANDQLDYGLLRPQSATSAFGREEYVNLVTETLAVGEYSSPNIGPMITRGHLMLTRYAQELRTDPDFVDIAGEYEKTTTLTLKEFEGLIFAVHSRFGEKLAQNLPAEPGLLPLIPVNFSNIALPPAKIDAFLNLVGASTMTMLNELRVSDNGPNDFTIFRKYPMVQQWFNPASTNTFLGYLMLDNHFFLEKVQTGPYWSASASHGLKLRKFWGAIFEKYVNDLMTRACSGTAAKFIADPRPADGSDIQICDGIVATQDALVLIEYKSSMFRADTKYSGNPTVLLKEIEKKLVRDKEANQKKGVQQLAAAVHAIYKTGKPQEVLPHIDWARIKRVYLSIVTLDSIGETIGMSALLNTFLLENLDPKQYPHLEIRPLYCMDIGSLERATSSFKTTSLPTILEQWFVRNPELIVSLSMIPIIAASTPACKWLMDESKEVFRRISKILFPNADPDKAIAEAILRKFPSA